MSDYTELVKALREYSGCRKGEIARITSDAADAIEERQQIADHYEQTAKDYWKEACEYKSQLPKRGKWIEESYNNQHNLYRCSVCGLGMLTNPDYVKKHKYCFACGAKMEVQDGEEN